MWQADSHYLFDLDTNRHIIFIKKRVLRLNQPTDITHFQTVWSFKIYQFIFIDLIEDHSNFNSNLSFNKTP